LKKSGKAGKGSSNHISIGRTLDRVDGFLKVTGKAQYAAEIQIPNLAYGVVVQSTAAGGRIEVIDTNSAKLSPGVIAIFSHVDQPMALPETPQAKNLSLFQNNTIHYVGQMIALVIADTLENASHAASLVRVSYSGKTGVTDFEEQSNLLVMPEKDGDAQRGNVTSALKTADVTIKETYTTPTENHNPMEPFATTAVWEGDSLTLYDSTQAVFGTRNTIATVLGVAPDKVRVISHFIGGGFGCKLSTWSHVVLAAMAANKVKRPVKLVLRRGQMYGPVGFRPSTIQTVTLAASKNGELKAIRHACISESSRFVDFMEQATAGSRMTYACDNVETSQRLVRLDIGKPTWMRAPGHAPGSFALESAMDELSYALKLDPIELRVRNFADKDQESGLPWSSNSLKECFQQGAKRFGWQNRTPAPLSMRDGTTLVGMGMATALHTCWRNPASALVRILSDGTALVQSGSQDIGTGTYTIMTQIAAEGLSLPPESVRFELGDSHLPTAPMSGGSTTSVSVGPAVALAASAAMKKLIETAIADKQSPLYGANAESVVADGGILRVSGSKNLPVSESAKQKSANSKSAHNESDNHTTEQNQHHDTVTNSSDRADSYQSIVARTKAKYIEAQVDNKPGDEEKSYSMSAFGAQFAEVRIDPELGTIRVSRFVGAYSGGRILNPKTARSQMIGGITFGIGMALTEATIMDHNLQRIINNDLAEYHIPVNADIGNIETFFVEEEDPHINVLGVKGVGELGITGAAAAIANAVYHATGKRIRDLPITLDKLM
jgi:xanthine dehydrogenase YagR molybdenum-binding subunit